MTETEARSLKFQIESEFPRLDVAVREPQNKEYQNMFYLAVRARQTSFYQACILNAPADWEQLKEVAAIVAAQPTTV